MIRTVLLVEDSGSSRDVTSHFLQMGGFRVLEAEDGEVALGIIKTRSVDMIVTDIMMPKMDGWTLYRETRKIKRYSLTPFLFLTVLDELENQIKGLSLGVDDYIPKPVTAQQLIARVNTALMRSQRLAKHFYRNPVNDLEGTNYFNHRLAQETMRSREHSRSLSLVVIGMQNYEALARGQADWFAESAAEKTGEALRSSVNDYDLVANMGVGRFAVLLMDRNLQQAKDWADNLRSQWKISLTWPETEQRMDVHIALTVDAVSPGHSDTKALMETRLQSFERKW
ncbi:MAG: response regulator [Mariprofundales bacterium]